MKIPAAYLLLCIAAIVATSVPSVSAGRGGRQCGYQDVWVDDGQELEGDTKRCRCDNGQWESCSSLGSCRRTQWPPSDHCKYECPANSCVKPGRQCVNNIYDCECASGYVLSNGRCEEPRSDYETDNNGPKSCLWQGKSYAHQVWRDNACQCFDGSWKCQEVGPKGCLWQGRWFAHDAWRDDSCMRCDDGSWKCSAPANPPPQEKGCTDNFSLPFGLENCVCDGAEVGNAAGLAACSRVATECLDFVSFSTLQDGALEAVQKVCDSLALDSCTSAAQVVPFDNPGCAELLQFGTNKCSPQQANDIFKRSVQFSCDPLCKDCARLG